jgi:hypothetical protein
LGNDLVINNAVNDGNAYHICYHICEQMFHPERDLRRIIIDSLGEEGESISALSRDLEKEGHALHRLILTGYLRALTDLNVLREKEVPPAKIYVPAKGADKDIYQVVGDKARQMLPEPDKADALTLFALGRLFKRPVFQEELVRAGVNGQPAGRQATKEERQEAKNILVKVGFKIPDSSRAFIIDSLGMEAQYIELMTDIIVEAFDIAYLVRETRQTKLSL